MSAHALEHSLGRAQTGTMQRVLTFPGFVDRIDNVGLATGAALSYRQLIRHGYHTADPQCCTLFYSSVSFHSLTASHPCSSLRPHSDTVVRERSSHSYSSSPFRFHIQARLPESGSLTDILASRTRLQRRSQLRRLVSRQTSNPMQSDKFEGCEEP